MKLKNNGLEYNLGVENKYVQGPNLHISSSLKRQYFISPRLADLHRVLFSDGQSCVKRNRYVFEVGCFF